MSKSSLLKNTLATNAYWTVNKTIARQLESIEAAALLSDLISKREYFKGRNELDFEGGFFNTADNLENDLTLTKGARQKHTKLLVDKGFLKVVKRGVPAKNYYYIQDEAIVDALSTPTVPIEPEDSPTSGVKTPPTSQMKSQPTRGMKNQPTINNNKKEKESKKPPMQTMPLKLENEDTDSIPETCSSTGPTFKSIVFKVLDNPKKQLLKKDREHHLDILIHTCLDNGLPKDVLSSTELIRLALNSVLNSSWKEDVKLDFERLVEVIYPSDIEIAQSKEDRELAELQRKKELREEYIKYSSPQPLKPLTEENIALWDEMMKNEETSQSLRH